MNWKRYLKGKVTLHYSHWQEWNHISFKHYWSGRILYFNFSKWSIQLDCRDNWLEDMITGKPT